MEENMKSKKIYTNSIGIEASVFDIKLKVNYDTSNEEKKAEKEELCEIVMSPQHAKAFLNVLNNTIKEYEKSFGEINLRIKSEEKGE